MRTIVQYFNGAEDTIDKDMVSEIKTAIESLNQNAEIYMIHDLRSEILVCLKELGWSDSIYLHTSSKISISSIKDKIGLCIQTGNVSRIYADLLKLQTLYKREIINSGLIILLTASAAKTFGKNLASLERLERELPIFQDVITMPIVAVGLY